MINIKLQNGILSVEDDSKEIFNWKHRAFFNISLGFHEDEEHNSFISTDREIFQDYVKEIINYFRDESISFETDAGVTGLIADIQQQESEFKEAKENIGTKITVSQSTNFKRKLKPYQTTGLEHFLKIKHGANFSVPGSGKTTMVYRYFDELKRHGIVDKIFVVGPFSSFLAWEEEAVMCFEKEVKSARLLGTKRLSYYLKSAEVDLFLCHYQTAANDKSEIIDLCNRHDFLFVVDESHYIKRFTGGVWSDALLSIAPHAKRRVVLSGTPMPNGLIDLWSQMTFLWPGKQVLGERNSFKSRCDDENQHEEIQREIRPFFYRVRKTDLKLPEPRVLKTEYLLNPIQAQIYKALATRLITEIDVQPNDRQKLKVWRKAKMVRLLQAASNPTLLNRYSNEFDIPPLSADGSSLIELIEKYPRFETPTKFKVAIDLATKLMSEGRKVLLWTVFIHNIDMLREILKGVKYFTIHGAVPKDENENEVFNREAEIRNFKLSNEPCMLIANPAACAESISLHKVCHDAIYLDRTFNCGQYIQSLDRIHRIGLEPDEVVTYHILIAKNTIDETIDFRLDAKHKKMLHILEDDIPIGDLEIEGAELEEENELFEDFKATVEDVKRFNKSR